MIRILTLYCFTCVALIHSVSCSKPESEPRTATDRRPTVYVVNCPLKYFAERIGGDAIDVVFPAIAGDPAFWKPGPDEVIVCQQADLILLNGASYAKWVDTVSIPQLKTVNTTAAVKDRYIEIEEEMNHTHGPGAKQAHGAVAFTTWLDPRLAIGQAECIEEAMSRKWPNHRDRFAAGFAALEKDLRTLDEKFSSITSGKGGVPLVMSHPVYQYLERRYGLNARSLHWEPDARPDEGMVKELKGILATHPAQSMIWESEPLAETAQVLSNLELGSIVIDPCANVPDEGDYLSVMHENAENLRKAVQ